MSFDWVCFGVRVMLARLLGRDLARAQKIKRVADASFRRSQVLHLDHWLGKAAMQKLTARHIGNALFAPLWRHEGIADVQITIAEALGIGTRASKPDLELQPDDGLELHLRAVKGGRRASNSPELPSPVSLDRDFDGVFLSQRVDAWCNDCADPCLYAAGSREAAAASALIARDGFAWAEEE